MVCGQQAAVDVFAGSSDDIVIPLFDDDGDPISSLTGWTARAQLRLDAIRPVIYEWSTETDPATIVLQDSSARLAVPDLEVLNAWGIRLAWFDLLLVDTQGKPNRPIRAAIRITPAITHD